MATTALLLIAHGSREVEANADLHYLVEQLRALGRYPIVEASFLELAEPTILQSGAECVTRGADRIILVPYFLSAGVHVRRDLTEARRQLSALYPSVEFVLAEPVGRHRLLIDVIVQRALEAENQPFAY